MSRKGVAVKIQCPACGRISDKSQGRCPVCNAPLEARQQDPLAGRQVGHFLLQEKIGSGGMGVVYRAEHHVLGTPYAVKILHPQFATDQDILQRFRREAVTASRLRHDNIVFVADFGWEDGIGSYIVMEMLEGRSLSLVLRQGETFSQERLLGLCRQVCQALGAAHRQKIVHRDLKPDNVFLIRQEDSSDRIKVLDFGIAKLAQEDGGGSKITGTGSALGTPRYMSPEQAAGRWSEVDQRTDIYAFGVILYEILAGQTPVPKTSFQEMLARQIQGDVPPLSTHRPDLAGSQIERALGWILAPAPVNRPGSVDEVMGVLEPAIRAMPSLTEGAISPPRTLLDAPRTGGSPSAGSGVSVLEEPSSPADPFYVAATTPSSPSALFPTGQLPAPSSYVPGSPMPLQGARPFGTTADELRASALKRTEMSLAPLPEVPTGSLPESHSGIAPPSFPPPSLREKTDPEVDAIDDLLASPKKQVSQEAPSPEEWLERRSLWKWVVVGFLAALVVGGGYVWLSSSSSPKSAVDDLPPLPRGAPSTQANEPRPGLRLSPSLRPLAASRGPSPERRLAPGRRASSRDNPKTSPLSQRPPQPPRLPRYRLRFKSSPRAVVYINGRRYKRTPCELRLKPGERLRYKLRRRGYRSVRGRWRATQDKRFYFRLRRRRPSRRRRSPRRRPPPRRKHDEIFKENIEF